MILLDPDLKTVSAPGKNLRLPSARTLARFLAETQKILRLHGQVTVLLTTDAAIRKLNRQFRHKDKATDVLSFPAEGSFPVVSIGAEKFAGDLAISVPTALRQAVEQGHSLSTEINVLILHGLLHLAGHDHESDAGQMARRERQLRAKLNLPQGLIERAKAKPAIKRSTNVLKGTVLKGHGFSRAVKDPPKGRALAPEGRSSGILRVPANPQTSTRNQSPNS
jgi:probable rRNA maturation factor